MLVMGGKENRAEEKKTEHMLPSGFPELLVPSIKELEVLLMGSESYCAEIVTASPQRATKPLGERAAQLAVITDSKAGLCSKENE